MPMQPLALKPGVDTQATPLLTGPGWSSCNLIRWKDGLLQKLGGCQQLTLAGFVGICRGLLPWDDLAGNRYLGIGTSQRLQVYTPGQAIADITPLVATSNLNNAFSTVAGSPTVTIADTVPRAVGDWVYIQPLVYVGGLLLQGFYQVQTAAGASYTITAGGNATTTVVSGGSVLSFTTTSGSHSVVVTLGSYAFTNGQQITVGVSTSVGGTTIYGPYTVAVAAGVASITVAAAATSSATAPENGGDAAVLYLLASAVESSTAGGYGFGPYGQGPYGESVAFVPNSLRVWTLGAWGADLVACPSGGSIYLWTPPIPTVAESEPAALLTNAPPANAGIFVATPEQILVAFGCTDGVSGLQDPMLLRWCDVDDLTDWTASTTNQAGSFRLSRGTRIVAGLSAPGQMLVWTDIGLWSIQYLGFPLVFGFNEISWACGLVSARAVAQAGPFVMWMSQNEFFRYDGQIVAPMPCPVWDQVFNNLDRNYLDSIFAAPNTWFDEVAWYYPTIGSNGVCTAYVKLNTTTGLWDYGTLSRSAWTDQSTFGAPIGTDYAGNVLQHELAADMNGVAMDAWAMSGLIGIAEGEQLVEVKRVLPDLIISEGGQVQLTFLFYAYQGDTPTERGPYTITASTDYVRVRGRGRYMQVRVESTGSGVFWRLGKIENQIAPAGRRP